MLLSRSSILSLVVLMTILGSPFSGSQSEVQADDPPSAAGSMLKLLKSGRVPESRLGTIVKLVCNRGNEHDLRFIFDEVVKPEHWSDDLRSDALDWLSEATLTRKVTPTGDLASLADLLQSDQQAIQSKALKLAGLWKVKSILPALAKAGQDPEASIAARSNALLAMSQIDPSGTKTILVKMAGSDQPFALKSLAVSVLAALDVKSASQLAADALSSAKAGEEPSIVLDAFLDLQNGSSQLAKDITNKPPSEDMAKLMLRHMYSLGRTDADLVKVLSKIAGISEDPTPLTKEQILELAEVITAEGDAKRGEEVFRRNDLSCMKCHAISKAGGQIGPDLSALGASSPMDYLIRAVLDPDKDIKEAYTTRVVMTIEGKIHQGIVADRTNDALVIKDATGKQTSIAIDDIDDEIEGKSLMPKGLVKFMTDREFNDLVKFLSMLGKPGDYAIRSTQRMQRWRLLTDVPESLTTEVPSLSSYEDLVLLSESWLPVYSRVNGDLPLVELTKLTKQNVVYVMGEVNVSKAGAIVGELNSRDGVTLWIEDEQITDDGAIESNLEPGIHRVILRVDTEKHSASVINLTFKRLANSEAQFVVVDGK